jgi:hypothetical protein
MAEFNGVNDNFFADFFRAGFDHHNAVGGTDDHNVHQALTHLIVGGVNNKSPADLTDAHGADGTEERNVGQSECGGCAVDSENIGIVAGIGGEHEGDDLGLALKPLGKHGTHWPINLAAGEHFALAHAAFALDEASGKASASVGVFAVVDGEGEEIDTLARVGIGDGGGEHNVIALANDGGAVGLLGQLSSFKRQFFAASQADGDNASFWFHFSSS